MLSPNSGLLTERIEGVLHLTIDRPPQLNALLTETLDELVAALRAGASDDGVKAAVIAGTGRFFCSGVDLSTVRLDEPQTVETVAAANRAVAAIAEFPHPVVGAVCGPALGVGVSLALACDLTVAAVSSYFRLAFTQVGLMPDGGATALVAASVGRARAMRMALLAESIGATEAAEFGLIAQTYPDEQFDDHLEELLKQITTGPAAAFTKTKQAINAATLGQLPDAMSREITGQAALLATADFAEGIAAFREKRPVRFTGGRSEKYGTHARKAHLT